jgi:uncharacterized membrane protein
MSDEKPILDYANARDLANRPLDSRIEVRKLSDGVEFVDPPAGLKARGVDMVMLGILGVVLVLFAMKVMLLHNRREFLIWLGLFAFAASVLGMALWETYLKATRPTILAVRGGRLYFHKPLLLGLGRCGMQSRFSELRRRVST